MARILASHFQPVLIKYGQYRRLGGLKLLIDPWIFLLLTAPILFLTRRFLTLRFAVPLALFTAVLAAFFAAPLRRKAALKKWMKQAGLHLAYRPPHVIAHSFGTYLTLRALQDMAAVHLQKIVLVGCVIHEEFDWKALSTRKPKAFEMIRNDWTNKDQVVRLAGWIERRIPDFGRAGLKGFREVPGVVHSVANPDVSCGWCTDGADATVHNFDCSGLGHSDSFLAGAHTVRYWLPFLWGFDVPEYWELLELCETAAEKHENGHLAERDVIEDEILHTEWKWAKATLIAFLTALVQNDPGLLGRSPTEIVGRAARLFWQTIERAREAARTRDADEVRWIVFLRPELAAIEAVKQVLAGP